MNSREIAVNQPNSVPPRPMSLQLDLALSVAYSALENGILSEAAFPSGVRVALESRARVLDASLTPAPRDAILTVLASISGMPTKAETDPANVKAFLTIEASDLSASGLPAWALETAARAYRLGYVGDGHWRPTAGDLASNARARVTAVYRERERINAVLRARIEPVKKSASAEQRKAVADGMRSLAAGMPNLAPQDLPGRPASPQPQSDSTRTVEAR